MNTEVKFKELTIAAIPAAAIELVWDQVKPLIERVEEKAPLDVVPSVIKEKLRLGHNLLVTISRKSEIVAINIMSIEELDSGTKVLYIPITAGEEMDLWLEDFLDVAKAIAKDYNCTELRGMTVRTGWLAKLKPYGWEHHFTTIRCEIGE